MHARNTHALVRLAVMVLMAAIGAPAMAGPPLITDDPDTLPMGQFELNTAYTLNLSERGVGGAGRTWEQEAPLFDLNYGLAQGIQLKFEVPLVVLDPAGDQPARAGIGDLSLGTKLRFVDQKDAPLSVSIYPAVGVPLGSPSQGLGTGSPSLVLPVQIRRRFLDDKLFVYADGGYEEQFAEGEGDLWFVGIAAEYELREGLVVCAELRQELGVRGGSDDSLFNVGIKWDLAEYAALIGSAGRSFDPSPDSGSALLLYLGVQWSF